MKANFLFVALLATNFLANGSTPDTLRFIDKPDFYEIRRTERDTSYSTDFITDDGFLDDENPDYKDAIMCRITLTVNDRQVGLREFINKGSGFWYEIIYNDKGGILMQGLLKETGKVDNVYDTINLIKPEPPYESREIAYRYHETIREGEWIFYDRQSLFNQRKIYYVNGVEQRKEK